MHSLTMMWADVKQVLHLRHHGHGQHPAVHILSKFTLMNIQPGGRTATIECSPKQYLITTDSGNIKVY